MVFFFLLLKNLILRQLFLCEYLNYYLTRLALIIMGPRCPLFFSGYLSESKIRHRGNTKLRINKDFLNVAYTFLFLSFDKWLPSVIKNFSRFLGFLQNNLFYFSGSFKTLSPNSIIEKKKCIGA